MLWYLSLSELPHQRLYGVLFPFPDVPFAGFSQSEEIVPQASRYERGGGNAGEVEDSQNNSRLHTADLPGDAEPPDPQRLKGFLYRLRETLPLPCDE